MARKLAFCSSCWKYESFSVCGLDPLGDLSMLVMRSRLSEESRFILIHLKSIAKPQEVPNTNRPCQLHVE